MSMIEFAAACFDQNSREELVNAIIGKPDLTDMETWDLNVDEWEHAIRIAIYAMDNSISVEESQKILNL